MQRFFYRRGQKVPVTEVQGVRAVQLDAATRSGGSAEKIGKPVKICVENGFESDAPEEEVAGLSSAGWVFVQPSTASARADRSKQSPAEMWDAEPVFQMPDGHILIGNRRLIVQFLPTLSDVDTQRELQKRRLTVVRALTFASNQFQVEVAPGEDTLDVANTLQECDVVVAAEPEFFEFIGQRITPTDPFYNLQWQLHNRGDQGGIPGADIAVERAWDITLGGNTRVAVIDNGFDVRHPDLNPAIVAESGFYDAVGDFHRTPTDYPDNDHGTFCAGMVGARMNNGVGGCGSAPECELILLAARADQVGSQATLARALAYAADPRTEAADAAPDTGADVIVSSLGPNGASWPLTSVLDNAIRFASQQGRQGRGTPIFWASSNGDNVDIALDQVVSHPDVIAVGRSRRDDREDDSARGQQLDFLAPGVEVVSTGSGGGMRVDTGTSFAAPLAAGVGALILSINPDLNATQVRHIMQQTCDKVGDVVYGSTGRHDDYGYGRINAAQAVITAMETVPGATDASVSVPVDRPAISGRST